MRRFTSSQPPSATHDGNTETVLRVTYAGDDYQHLSRQSLDLTYSQTKDLREQCQALKANIDTLSKVLEANLNLPRKVQDTLEQIRTSSSCFSSHFDDIWDVLPPYLHQSAAFAAKAQEVFSTPELLEQILLHINTTAKLDAMLVQRCWKNTILGSIKLKRLLGLSSFDDKFYYSPFSPRFSESVSRYGLGYKRELPYRFYGESISDANCAKSNQGLEVKAGKLDIEIVLKCDVASLQFGPRFRSMLIANPPVKQMGAALDCRPCRKKGYTHFDSGETLPHGDPHQVPTTSPDGFTVGELADRTQQIMTEHPDCQSTCVNFKASMLLDECDPIRTAYRRLGDGRWYIRRPRR